MRRIVLALMPIVVIVVAYARYGPHVASAKPQVHTLDVPSPDQWVPFRADVERSRAGSAERMVGRYFRGEDGSTRSELGVEGERAQITIMNVSTNTYYQLSTDISRSHPMRVSSQGWRPLKMRETNVNLGKAANTIESFQVRQLSSPGIVELVAPELNFFALISDNPVTGTRRRYYNIVKGRQESSLFEPPGGAFVQAHLMPMGMFSDGSAVPKTSDLRAEHK